MDESVRNLLQVAGENPDIMTHEELNFARTFIDQYQKAPPVPKATYPSTTLNRNNGAQLPKQQPQTGFTMAPLPQQPPKPMTVVHQTPQQHHQYQPQQHSYATNEQIAPPPAPARDSSMYGPTTRQQPARPPPMERPPAPAVYKVEKPVVSLFNDNKVEIKVRISDIIYTRPRICVTHLKPFFQYN